MAPLMCHGTTALGVGFLFQLLDSNLDLYQTT